VNEYPYYFVILHGEIDYNVFFDNMKRSIVAFCLILIFVSLQAQNSMEKKYFNKEIDSLFSEIYTKADEAGAAVLIMKDGHKLFEKCYGVADVETQKPITPYTNFCIASVSKQFSAVALLQLVERGMLSLDDNLKKIFPEYKADFFNRIKIRHILSHTSGITDDRDRSDRNFVLYATDTESCKYLIDFDKLHFEPGTQYEYIDCNFELAYQIIQRTTGMDFDTYMKRNLFDVAGMKHTVYFEDGRFIKEMAHGYSFDKSEQRYVENDYGEANFFATKADGALYTSITDFAKWEKALRDNKVWNETSKQLAYTPQVMIPKNANYGYNKDTGYGFGFFVQQVPGEPKIIYHIGDNGGFYIYAGKVPEKDILVMFFANRDGIDRIATADSIYRLLKQHNWFE
jgi:CubicO group peptidase (beta-lactamase class C family)